MWVETVGAIVRAACWPATVLLLVALFRPELRALLARTRSVSVAVPGVTVTAATEAARAVATTLAARGMARLVPPGPPTGSGRVVWLGADVPDASAAADALRARGVRVVPGGDEGTALGSLAPGDVLVLAGRGGDGPDPAALADAAARRGAAVVAFRPN